MLRGEEGEEESWGRAQSLGKRVPIPTPAGAMLKSWVFHQPPNDLGQVTLHLGAPVSQSVNWGQPHFLPRRAVGRNAP